MEEFNMVPIYRNGFEEISDGIDVMSPEFCKRNCGNNDKCREHYMKLQSAEDGLYVCPYGFVSYVFSMEEDRNIFTCLRVVDQYDRKKVLPKIENEKKVCREISYHTLLKYVDAYKEFYEKQFQYKNYKKFIDDIFHDVRNFNKQIKSKNDRIYRKSQQSPRFGEILELSKSIQVMGWFLTLRLNNHDFIYNEALMRVDVKTSYNIFKIIDKVRHCMKHRADEKNITLDLRSPQLCRDMQAYDCIELLPFLVLDNAIKYSPNGEMIHIMIEERGNIQHVQVRSLGPVVRQDELKCLTKQGFRGINAKQFTDDGMGIGLYTSKCICELNGIIMELGAGSEVLKRKNNIDYSEFVVDFRITL